MADNSVGLTPNVPYTTPPPSTDISQFNAASMPTDLLSQINAVTAAPPQITSDANAKNIAAHTAILTPPDKMGTVYNDVVNDIKNGGNGVSTGITNQWDAANYDKDQKSLVDIASDPSLTPDQRAAAVKSFSDPYTNKTVQSYGARTAQAAGIKESEPTDNAEQDATRFDATVAFDKVDNYNQWKQNAINAYDNASKPDMLNTVGQFVQTLIPFFSNASSSGVLAKLPGTNVGDQLRNMVLGGEGTKQIREMLNNLPIDQQKDFAQKVMDAINNTSGPTAFSANHFVQMDMLHSFLDNGSVDRGEAMDNVMSLLNDSIFAGPITKLFGKGAEMTVAAGKRVNAGTVSQYTKAMEAVSQPPVAEGVQNIAEAVVPKPTANDIIDQTNMYDNVSAATIDHDRGILQAHLDAGGTGDIEAVLGQLHAPDSATSSDIAQARQVLQQAQATGTTSIPTETIDGVKTQISDHIINRLEQLDNAPIDAYHEIRQAVSDRVDGNGVGSKTIGTDTVNDVNGVLANHNLPLLDSKQTGHFKSYITQATQESNIRRGIIRSGVQPTSVSQVIKDVNPAMARAASDAVVADPSGAVADALYGTSRTDAVANDALGEPTTVAGSIRNKVAIDESKPVPDIGIINAVDQADVANEFTQSEKAQMRSAAKDDWRDVQGLYPRQEMSVMGDSPKGVKFGVTYGPKDGGFTNPIQAIEQAKFGLRKYGVVDSDIHVLRRVETGDYLPTRDFTQPGDYLIHVSKDYRVSPADTLGWSLDVHSGRWKLFDTVIGDGSQGGLAQHFIPSTTYIDKALLNPATRAADKASWIDLLMHKKGNKYVVAYSKLDKTQKYLVDDYIRRANAKGLKFDPNFLKAAGMTDDAVNTVRQWKETQDTLYHFENADLNKTLRNRGYMKYVDQEGHNELVVRPLDIRKTGGLEAEPIFDGNGVKKLSREDIRLVYERGGTIAETRGAQTFDGNDFSHIVVDNRSSTSYLRRINDSDYTLNYRDGYYQVKYKDPLFIDELQPSGKWRAIATADGRKAGSQLIERLRTTAGDAGKYRFRPDAKNGTEAGDAAQFEVNTAQGRTSQRIRGQRLGNASETSTDLNDLHIASPEESLINQIRSMSNRVSHRDFLDTAKARFKAQFTDLLREKNGIVMFPDDIRQIKGTVETPLGKLKDAQTMWRFIDGIDSGYVNLLDDISKKLFKDFSDLAGRAGWGWLEKGLGKAAEVGPSGFARKKAFRLLLASNPARQLPVQALQALPVILATNPLAIPKVAARFVFMNYIARGGDVKSFLKAGLGALTGLDQKSAQAMVDAFETSGFKSAAHANSYIRDDMHSLIDRSNWQRFRSLSATPLNITQKYGFEAGENAMMKSVWLSEYEKLERAGQLTAENLDTMAAKVRHLTGNMNRAGELPYNSNTLSAFMQFFQMPHKMFAQVIMGHTGLTTAERMRLGMSYVLTYGIGAGFITEKVREMFGDHNAAGDIVEGGMFNLLLNNALGTLYGGKVAEDWSDSLRVLQLPNIVQFGTDVMQANIGQAITASPSASLVYGDNPRITNLVRSFAEPFTPSPITDGHQFIDIGRNFLQMFSGASNFFKGQYILEHGRAMSNSGTITDFDSNYLEGFAKMAGFSSIDEMHRIALDNDLYQASNKFKNDIDYIITQSSSRLAQQGISNDEADWYVQQLAEASRVWQNNPAYMKEVVRQLKYKATQGDTTIFKRLLSNAGIIPREQMERMITEGPSNLTTEQRDVLKATVKYLSENPVNGTTTPTP